MKTAFGGRQLVLAVATLVLAGGLPVQAARFGKFPVYQTAVFETAGTTRIAVGTDHSGALFNLKAGDHVSIAYDQENGHLVARHISDGVPPQPRAPGLKSARAPFQPKKASVFEHIHGIVQSVNVQAGTLTLAYRVK